MKYLTITIILLSSFFELQAQQLKLKQPKNNLKFSLTEISFNNTLNMAFERQTYKNQSVEILLSTTLGEKTDWTELRAQWFDDIQVKETILSIGYKFYQRSRKKDPSTIKNFKGFFFKPELFVGVESKFNPDHDCDEITFLPIPCYDSPVAISRQTIYGVLMNIGYQYRHKKGLSIEISGGLGQGINHSFESKYSRISESGRILQGNITMGYAF